MPNNRFFLMRHGQSQANVEGLICSDPARGRTAYGLTERGRQQVRHTAETMRASGQWHQECALVTSPFLRTVQTAEIVAAVLGIAEIKQDEQLRERFFGTLEGGKNSQYQQVWDQDQRNPDHTRWQVESVTQVAQRGRELIDDLNERYQETNVILIAHGDICSILATAFSGLDLGCHRRVHSPASASWLRLPDL